MTGASISISYTHDYGTHADKSSLTVSALRRDHKSGRVVVSYQQPLSEAEPPADMILTIDGTLPRVKLHRRGDPLSDMVFSPGKKHGFRYRTPMGVIPMYIETHDLTVTDSDGLLSIEIKYGLSDEDSPLSLNTILIRIS